MIFARSPLCASTAAGGVTVTQLREAVWVRASSPHSPRLPQLLSAPALLHNLMAVRVFNACWPQVASMDLYGFKMFAGVDGVYFVPCARSRSPPHVPPHRTQPRDSTLRRGWPAGAGARGWGRGAGEESSLFLQLGR